MSGALLLAGEAVALAAPYLVEAGKGAAKKLGEGVGGKLWSWLGEKLTGRAKEALDDLEKNPGAEDNQADLRKQLTKLLEADPTLLAELRALLPPAPATETTLQTQTVGDHGRGVQNKGDNNTTNISG